MSPPEKTSSAGGDHGQGQHAVAVDLAVGLQGEDVRQVVVPGQQLQQHRQPAEGGVRGQRQQHHGRELDDVEGPVVAERGVGELGEDGDALDRLEVEAADQHRQADQHHAEQRAERDLGALGPPDARERGRTARRWRWPPHRSARSSPRRKPSAGAARRPWWRCPRAPRRARRPPPCSTGASRNSPTTISTRIAADEDGGRHDERPRRLHDPAQVHRRDQHQHDQAQPQPVAVQRGEGRGQRGHTGRDRHRHVQDVVQDQRGRRHQAGARAQVRLGHRVRRRRRPGTRRSPAGTRPPAPPAAPAMARVTGSVNPSPCAPAAASTRTIASGPYATDAIASSDSAASPVTAVSRCRSPVSGGSSSAGSRPGLDRQDRHGIRAPSRKGPRTRGGDARVCPGSVRSPPCSTPPCAFFAREAPRP